MSLTKQDLNQIKGVVSEIVTKEVDALAVITAQGFEDVENKIDSVDRKLSERIDYNAQLSAQRDCEHADKIDGVAKMLSGDLEPVYDDVANLKSRVTKPEQVVL